MASKEYLEYELLAYISEFIKIMDDSNDWFLLSRFANSPKRRELYLKKHEEVSEKAQLIVDEIGLPTLQALKELIKHG